MKLCVKKTNFFLVLIYSFFFFITLLEDVNGKWLLSFSIFMCLLFMRWHRNSQSMLIVLFFITTYFIYMIPYYYYGVSYSAYNNLQTLEYTNGTLRVISLFVLILFIKIHRKRKNEFELRHYLRITHNSLVYSICSIIMISIFVYAFLGNNILHHSYGKGTTNSSIFEYYFVFAIIAQCYAKRRIEKVILFCINAAYGVVILLLGLRLVFLIDCMMIFIFYFENRFKTRWVILGSIIGFFCVSAMAWIRIGITEISLLSLFGINENGVMMTNQGDVFLTSTVHYGIVQNGFMILEDRISSLMAFIANIFLPFSAQFKIGILNQYIKGIYSVGGGGFGAMYAYVWLGYAGVIFLAIYISRFINNIYESKKSSYYGVFLIITIFRWFSYSLTIIFKMGLYLVLVYYMFNLLESIPGERVKAIK